MCRRRTRFCVALARPVELAILAAPLDDEPETKEVGQNQLLNARASLTPG